MHNDLIYEAYIGFFLKSLLWVGLIFLLIVALIIIIDTIFVLFAPRHKAMVVRADIAPLGRENRLGSPHAIFIFYEFDYKGKTYKCTNLNSFKNNYRKNLI